MNNIKVNVIGPMKSGKSKIVKIIEEATAGMGIEVTEQNVQDEPTAESGFAKPAEAALEPQAGGGSAPSSCSAWCEKTHENGLISFAMGESFGGISSNREKIEWLKKFMES